jgi:signal transduction histidine kinase
MRESPPRARRSGIGHPRRRLFILAALLVFNLTLGAGLAWDAIRTARRHRDTARKALEDYASFAAFILASQTYRQLGGAVVETFASWPPAGQALTLPAGASCPSSASYFYQPPGESIRMHGQSIAPGALAALRDTLQYAMPLLEEVGWRFRFLRLPSPGMDGWFITSYQASPGRYGLRGFAGCLGQDSATIRRVMLSERALPPSVTGDLPADSLFSVTLSRAAEPPLYTSPSTYSSPYRGASRLGTEFGDLALSLQLRPDLADRLVIGGIPRSRMPFAAGMLGLSTLLAVTALLQIRREYELIAIRSDFISNVSHELRTPLSQILIFTELLKLGRLRSSADRERSLDIMEQEVRRLIRLVENVLQFAPSGKNRRKIECQDVRLQEIVQETLDAFRPLALARGATLVSDLPPDLLVRADHSALRQILLNLLDNAVKYGPRDQTVRVSAERHNGRTRIVVDDQGPGIPFDDRERVWEGYFRLPRETRSAVGGSGIGLAVVRSLVEEMEGTTWVEDADTGGARLVVELESGRGEPG